MCGVCGVCVWGVCVRGGRGHSLPFGLFGGSNPSIRNMTCKIRSRHTKIILDNFQKYGYLLTIMQ